MKTPITLALLAIGAAYAQRPNDAQEWRNNGPRIEGNYESYQKEKTIVRKMHLDRDGRVEIVTEVRNGRNDRRDDNDFRRFGWIAEEASRGRPVRTTGCWSRRDDRIILRMDEFNPRGRDRRSTRSELEIERRGDELTIVRGDDVYGRADIKFRPDDGWGGNDVPRLGMVHFDRDDLRLDSVEFGPREAGKDRLIVRAGGRTIDLLGWAHRRDDVTTFKIPMLNRNSGELTLRMRGDRIVSISGSVVYERHHLDFDK